MRHSMPVVHVPCSLESVACRAKTQSLPVLPVRKTMATAETLWKRYCLLDLLVELMLYASNNNVVL